MHILYPSSPLRIRQPDEQFAAESEAVRSAGFEVSVFSMEDFQGGEFRSSPAMPSSVDVLYRGWMISATEYRSLISNLSQIGARPVTPLDDYLSSHHLPNWYSRIPDLTPETRIFPPDCDLEGEL